MSAYPFAVIPGPGQYGDFGHARSHHRTAEAAKKAAEKATRELRAAMAKHGGTSGYFYAAEFSGSKFHRQFAPDAI